jgi:hypothetical protein
VKPIDFMSEHRKSYPQMSNEGFVKTIRHQELMIGAREKYYIPKANLAESQGAIQPGDVIGITTSVEGLDISHTGIAVSMNGAIKYLHAPLSNGAVQISDNSLTDYLALHKNQTGVMVARPLEPHE